MYIKIDITLPEGVERGKGGTPARIVAAIELERRIIASLAAKIKEQESVIYDLLWDLDNAVNAEEQTKKLIATELEAFRKRQS